MVGKTGLAVLAGSSVHTHALHGSYFVGVLVIRFISRSTMGCVTITLASNERKFKKYEKKSIYEGAFNNNVDRILPFLSFGLDLANMQRCVIELSCIYIFCIFQLLQPLLLRPLRLRPVAEFSKENR